VIAAELLGIGISVYTIVEIAAEKKVESEEHEGEDIVRQELIVHYILLQILIVHSSNMLDIVNFNIAFVKRKWEDKKGDDL